MDSVHQPALTLRQLNGDVLRVVCELLRPGRCLRPLSMTCKWLRAESYPVLFRECIVQSNVVDRKYDPAFIPCSLWPYVCTLSFSGCFSRREIQWMNAATDHGLDDYRKELGFHNQLIPVKQVSAALRIAFRSMQALSSVYISMPERADRVHSDNIPGISPYILEAILSTPHLRHLTITGPLFHFHDSLPSNPACLSLAELSSFDYYHEDLRSSAQVPRAEREQVVRILARTHDHLQHLHLPAECAPLDQMATWHWPLLRSLSLRGERVASSLSPTYMLSKMPRLHTASLFLAEPANGSDSPPTWPASPAPQIKWRNLEVLDITHPNPEDELYSHLSHDLLSLGLRCWPRYYKLHTGFQDDFSAAGVQWSSPLLSSSEMLRILQRLEAPRLNVVDLEFRADSGDMQLFHHIGRALPSLEFLCIHRYRMAGEKEVPLAGIARALSALRHLKLLMLHLDFADLPDVCGPVYEFHRTGRLSRTRAQQLTESDATLARAANTMATLLGPSLQYIFLLRPRRDALNQWIPFRVVRSTHPAEVGEQITAVRHLVQKCGEPIFPYGSLWVFPPGWALRSWRCTDWAS
ncbi:hypothetical protein FKP32DRAFT_1619950 [Trametes sanguinea]|nr:hypothetical protein FKP32DRAFT_1619950 [Trametes sanguinea]